MTMVEPEAQHQIDLWNAYERLDHAFLVRDEVAIRRELSLIDALQQHATLVELDVLWRALPRTADTGRESRPRPQDVVEEPDLGLRIERQEVRRRTDTRGDVSLVVRIAGQTTPGVLRLQVTSGAEAGADRPPDPVTWLVALAPDVGDGGVTGGLLVEHVGDWLRTDVVWPVVTPGHLVEHDGELVDRSVRAADYDGRRAWRAVLDDLPDDSDAAALVRAALPPGP